jgi:hypothetical protein
MYSIGTIKLTWIDSNNNRVLHSNMFNSIEDALKETTGKKNWLIFKLKEVKNNNYSWDLLPYGAYKSYQFGMSFIDNKILLFTSFALVGFGIYSIIKMIRK